ncbi:MAG: hypothetical protein HY849_00785 [Nitrosomonadales bacterium]|nr:hypothetical protein [Nitrosomonadales bacterium]
MLDFDQSPAISLVGHPLASSLDASLSLCGCALARRAEAAGDVLPAVAVSLTVEQLKLLSWILSDHIESIQRDPQYLDPECIPELEEAIEDVLDIQRLLIDASHSLGGLHV